jgi:hypothetical protein
MELGVSFLDVGTVGQVSWVRRQIMVQAAKVVQMMAFTLLVIAVTLVVLRGSSSSIASCTRSSVAEAGANDNNIKSMSHITSSSGGGGNRIPSTLDGPFVPVTIPLDPSIRLSASQDLPQYDPRVVKRVAAIYPEQIFLSLSTPDAMWVSWVTGDSQIGPKVTPLDPSSVASVVVYGTSSGNYTHMAYGKSEVYSQTYPFEGVLNYTSGIIHHVHITGPLHLVLLLMFLLLSLV